MTRNQSDLVQVGGYTTQNRIELVRGGAPYFDVLEKLIDDAAESLHFQMYIYEADETGTRIADALIRAANRGVKVYMLLKVPRLVYSFLWMSLFEVSYLYSYRSP